VLPEHLAEAHKHAVYVTLGSWPVLEAWLVRKDRARAHLKIDSGMARQGFLADEAPKILQLLQKNGATLTGISTHFANVEDVTDYSYADKQLAQFGKACQIFESAGMSLVRHAASSASAMLLVRSRFDMVRVGIAYYGFWPSQATRISFLQTNRELMDLKPVMSWRTQITGVKSVGPGSYVGYGCTYRAVREMRVAVLPVGYYEGYPRNASNHGAYVLVHGQRCPLIGRICMNMMMIDVSHVTEANVGDIVTLIGNDQADSVKAEDLASWSDTIHYEIVARLHPEIPRRLVS
jgi:alanine racemase